MRFLRTSLLLTALLASLPATPAAAPAVHILVQSSPLAGSQFYELTRLLPQLQAGDHLDLVREPGNRHDRNAIRVDWRGRQLGYVPRRENRALAAAMDRGEKPSARISRLRPIEEEADPWRRLEFEVYLEL